MGRANGAGLWAEAGPTLCSDFSDFPFLFIFSENHRNFKIHQKYNKTQKNMK
jgi:hypothetical protein